MDRGQAAIRIAPCAGRRCWGKREATRGQLWLHFDVDFGVEHLMISGGGGCVEGGGCAGGENNGRLLEEGLRMQRRDGGRR